MTVSGWSYSNTPARTSRQTDFPASVSVSRAVDVADCTTADEIAARVFDAEKIAYPEAIRQVLARSTT